MARPTGSGVPVNKDMAQLAKKIRKQGWETEHTGSGHILATGPSGQQVRLSNSPSDGHAFKNAKRDLIRAGAVL